MTERAAIASIILCLQGAKSSAAEPSVAARPEATAAASANATDMALSEPSRAPGVLGRQHHIGFSASSSFFRERDELASPLAYQGLVFGGSLSYEYRGDRQDHWAYLGLGEGSLKAAIAREAYPPGTDMGTGALVYANLRYGYHHEVHRLGRLDLSAGAVLDLASHYFKPNGPDDFFWLNTYGLNAGVMARYQAAEKHTLVTRVFSPVVVFLSRPAWSIYDNPTQNTSVTRLLVGGQTALTSLNGYRAVTARFDYEYRFSPRWCGTASYEIAYRSSSIFAPVNSLQNSILVGLSVGN
jgi:hypothetical protein